MAKAKEHSAASVLSALADGPYRTPAHTWLYEVGNATGSRCDRHADALVISLWPSRGIWFAGVEAKVSRSDWKKELDQPHKAAAIQRFCNYWWVAAPAGIIELSEVPETWGLYEIEGKRAKVSKQAPKLEPEPLSATFVAAIMRNASEGQSRAIENATREKSRKLEEQYSETEDGREKHRQMQNAADHAKRQTEHAESRLATLQKAVELFEREAGLPEHTIGGYRGWSENRGAQWQAAGLLKRIDELHLARQFREVAEALERAGKAPDGASEQERAAE